MAVASLADIDDALDPDLRVAIPEQVAGRSGKQLAYKNNNPGNVEFVGQPGAEVGEDGRFAKFQTPEAGLADVHRVIGLHQQDSLQKYLETYAPPKENDTAAYVLNAAKALGVSADTPLSKIDRHKLAEFQVQQESSSKVSRIASLADVDEAAPPTVSLADIDAHIDAPPPAGAPSLLDRGKALAQQAREFGTRVKEQALKPGLGFADAGIGEKVVKPWSDAAASFVQEATAPLENVPGGSWLRRALHEAIDKGGESAAGALEFITSPAGIATAPIAAGEGLVGGAARSTFAGLQAPKAVEDVSTAIKEPTPENIAGAAVSTAAAAAPMGPELVRGGQKVVQAGEHVAGGLERHNAEAERLVQQEHNQGTGAEVGKQILQGEDMPVKMGDQTVLIRAAGGAKDSGRPFYQVIGPDGKPIFAGFGQNVQEFLRQRGARPVNAPPEAAGARYPDNQPTGDIGPGNPPSARATAAKPTIPEEGTPEHVERAVDARERLAQDLTGKSFKELSNSERLVVDHFVTEGYGFAVQGEKSTQASLADITPEGQLPLTAQPVTPQSAKAHDNISSESKAVTPTPATPSAPVSSEAAPIIPENMQAASLSDIDIEEEAPAAAAASGPVLTPNVKKVQEITPPAGASEEKRGFVQRAPTVAPAQGAESHVSIPGTKTDYPVRYAVMEASDVQPSHNPQNFEPNPAYEHQNDRDYTSVENAARVVDAAQNFRPEFVLTKSPTAELGTSIVDGNGNVLGGNNRAMALKRVYESGNPESAAEYKAELVKNADTFGIDPAELARFQHPILVRQAVTGKMEQPPAGHIRLYRGEPTTPPARAFDQTHTDLGRWFTPELQDAKFYGKSLKYLDVTKPEYERMLAEEAEVQRMAPGSNPMRGKGVLVSAESAGQAQPFAEAPWNSQHAITDFNKPSAAALKPGEQAVADGRRLSVAALKAITGSLDDLGEDGTLAQALRGDNGKEIVNHLIKAGVITEQERNGYLDDKEQLTPEIKDRIAKAIVGRLFKTPKELSRTTPETRAKLERIAPQLLRVEDRKGWGLTEPVKQALVYLEELRARGARTIRVSVDEGDKPLRALARAGLFDAAEIPSLIEQEGPKKGNLTAQGKATAERLFRENQDNELLQAGIGEAQGSQYSPIVKQIARKLQEGPIAAARAFRMYANDESMSREGAQTTLYEPPTQREAFDTAFGVTDHSEAPDVHKFSSTQVDLPAGVAAKVRAFAESIPEKELGEDGREGQPHVTVLYGLHAVEPTEAAQILEGSGPVEATFGKISIFAADKDRNTDVLKVEVKSPDLAKLNQKLRKGVEFTNDYPDYKPHVTIAYVKAGEGKKYVGKSVPGLTGETIPFDHVTFSSKDGTLSPISLTAPGISESRADRPLGLHFPARRGWAGRMAPKGPMPVWWKTLVNDARWSTKRGPLGTTFYVNEETTQIMRTALEEHPLKINEFLGLHMDSYSTHEVAGAIAKMAHEYDQTAPAVSDKMLNLAASMANASTESQGLIVIKIRESDARGPGFAEPLPNWTSAPTSTKGALRRVVDTLRHERIHAAQSEFGNQSIGGGPSPAAAAHIGGYEAHKILEDFPGLRLKLAEKGYDMGKLRDARVVVTEAAAHIGAGQDLGMTLDQDVDFLDAYFLALETFNPAKSAASILRLMTAQVKGAYARRSEVRRSTSPRDASRPRHLVEQEQDRYEEPVERVASPQLDDRLGSLFGDDAERAVDEETRRDRAQLEGAQLTAQLNAPLSRAEQLRRLRRDKTKKQASMFETEEPEAQPNLFDDQRGSAKISALTLGLDKFIEQDVAPTLGEAARTILQTSDDIVKILLPTARGGPSTKRASLILRNRLSELARQKDRAEAALAVARKYFEKAGDAKGREFILRYFSDENAPLPQFGDRDLDGIARVLRNLLDGRRDDVQDLGKGKLGKFYTNYFPRVWKDWRKAEGIFASFYGRRPLEGGKGFLKQRKHLTIQDALDKGLEPVSWNPIELVLLKVVEMDRYVMAHRVLEDWVHAGIAQFVDAREGKAPHGWQKVADPIGTIYGPSIQQISEYPNEGIWRGLNQVAAALGLKHERGFDPLNRGTAIGLAYPSKPLVKTMHGTAEDVLAHEIGHQIDWLAGSGNRFVVHYPSVESVARIRAARRTLAEAGSSAEARKQARQTLKAMKPDIQKRKAFAAELRALADLRSGRKEYTHKREEKMALLAEMWVGARELFQKTAPLVYTEWKAFLEDTPKLHALRDIEGNTEVTRISQPYDVGGLVIRGHWWAPEGAARILNNYLSPSLRTTSGAYKAVMGANNVLNQFQLGLSAFHLGFTSADAAVSKAALGFEAILRGKPIAAVKAFAGVPLAPLTTMIEGNKLLREWGTAGSQGGEITKLVDGLVLAGGRARMEDIYGTRVADKMRHAFRNGNWFGGLIRAPFAVTEAISDVLMKEIVPRQKLGVFADLARFELERLGPEATADETRAALATVWDSVENRMGQMTYDNLFWNRFTKDMAMISVRSVGWNLGTLREVGGGAIDLVKIPIQAAGGKPPAELNIHRVAYLMGLVTVSAIMGAIYQYLRTGKAPEEPKDLFFPKTGQLDESGRPQRAALPTYVKDIYHYFTEPGKTIANKVAPIWSGFAEMIRNEDFYGTEIRNADDPLIQQMHDVAKYIGRTAEPFGIRNVERDRQMRNPVADQIGRAVGIVPAPAAIEKSKAERLASELARAHIPAGSRTHAEADRREAEQTISRLAKAGKDYADQARDYVQSGVLTSKDVHAAALRSQAPPLLRTARSLPLDDLLQVWKAATADERAELRPLLVRHLGTLKDLPAAQRATLTPKLERALTE